MSSGRGNPAFVAGVIDDSRLDGSVDNESRLSPSTLGAAGVTVGQLLRVPQCLRTDRDDTRDVRRVFVDVGRDGGVVLISDPNGGSGNNSESVVTVDSESPLVHLCVLSVTHAMFQMCKF